MTVGLFASGCGLTGEIRRRYESQCEVCGKYFYEKALVIIMLFCMYCIQ